MYYIAVVKGSESRYPEHYETEEGFRLRYPSLANQAMCEGEGWSLYISEEEPYECALVRLENPPKEGEDILEYQSRLGKKLDFAMKATASKLTPTMPDDRPEWYKAGFPTKKEWEIHIESGKEVEKTLELVQGD